MGYMNKSLSINQQKVLALFDSKSRVTVFDVVKSLKIPRPTAKQVLTKLVELDILEQKGRQRGSYYTFKQESEILDPSGKQIVVVYKGMQSFQNLFNRLGRKLKKGDYYWSFAFKDEYHDDVVSKMLVDFHKEITDKGVDDKTIAHRKIKKIISRNFKDVKKLKIKYTSMDIPVGMIILEKAIINLVWGKQPLAILISAPEIYRRYQDFFKSIWKQSK